MPQIHDLPNEVLQNILSQACACEDIIPASGLIDDRIGHGHGQRCGIRAVSRLWCDIEWSIRWAEVKADSNRMYGTSKALGEVEHYFRESWMACAQSEARGEIVLTDKRKPAQQRRVILRISRGRLRAMGDRE
ncbi:hypothetical protein PMZ80_002587 [Knufia obscura]|uniref:Uncharacterized protein n=2 Tax=Knufia TaxID=430999 RepID=A0AAN8EH30_9EURO|nr:hypothetical protein PMZ80_002587 [Knufia obscura]KAK5951368.1 hypothetical protein OHC33_007424 [Knufia fluminis]